MRTVRKYKDKEYVYTYRGIMVSEEVHSRLSVYALKNELSLAKAINKLLNENEKR